MLALSEPAHHLEPAVSLVIPSPPAGDEAPLPTSAGTPAHDAKLSPLPHFEIQRELPPVMTIDLVSPPDDLWERVRNGFSMPNLMSDLVAQHQAAYLNRPQYLARVLDRSRRYLFHIVEALEKRGLPTELALLPMVESAFNPMALSPARASGLWQFIPSTGRNYQLKQDWWVDERRDIVASTSAALDYLSKIYEMHGDWHLALASYNWGENAVARAIERNRARGLPTDYTSLTMPAETRNYVPKLQALKNIIAQPHLFSVALEPIPNRPYFVTVSAPGKIDLALAARFAETGIDEFRALNPGHNRPVANGGQALVVPADKADAFLSNLQNHDQPLVTWQTYTLRKGDRLDGVAKRFGISLATLKQINGIPARARLASGHSLLVPARNVMSVREDAMTVNLPAEEAPAARKGRGRTQIAMARTATRSTSAPTARSSTSQKSSAGKFAKGGKVAKSGKAAKARTVAAPAGKRSVTLTRSASARAPRRS